MVAKIGGQEFQAKFTRIASSSIAILASTSDAAIGSSPRELLALEASVSSSVPLGTRAQVAAAHTLVLDRLTELVEDNHLSIPDWGRDLRTITTTLSSATVISVAEGRALADFGQLTDLVESVDDSELTDPLVREYVALASALLRALERPQGEG
ncbi:hypothetical protein ITJ43_14320 [Microbacterium sp. VKM Ac-2870]|uniref:hypothetical protein n=1 Tax=Microbacterium sp. VKM Ac-2870 TaxID=2783825 RepID=UPI00188C7EED|nr:hypothetical protein [Microbacterium sp. VKM Ac-2870]MBF4563306.1 hypothetical protein [Microbacterium sp. VKM Ac-2870]